MGDTLPITNTIQTAPHSVIAPSYTAPDGSVYVHHHLTQVVAPWAVESHIGPVKTHESFGDVESWAEYVKRYGGEDEVWPAFLTWNNSGLRAVLDYHGTDQEPSRCQWTAAHPFELTPQWKAWAGLADGRGYSQKHVLEFLEDHAPEIVSPSAAEIVSILRMLRTTVSSKADTQLLEDGSTKIHYTKQSTIKGGGEGEVTLPSVIAISVPVLKGHTEPKPVVDDRGQPTGAVKQSPVNYSLDVRMRPSVDDDGRLVLRLTMPRAEFALEAAYADRVEAAKAALGEAYTLLRAS